MSDKYKRKDRRQARARFDTQPDIHSKAIYNMETCFLSRNKISSFQKCCKYNIDSKEIKRRQIKLHYQHKQNDLFAWYSRSSWRKGYELDHGHWILSHTNNLLRNGLVGVMNWNCLFIFSLLVITDSLYHLMNNNYLINYFRINIHGCINNLEWYK